MATKGELQQMGGMMADINTLKKDVSEINKKLESTASKEDVKGLKEAVDNLPALADITLALDKRYDKRYAPKWVATAVGSVICLILGAVVTAWVGYVVIHPTQNQTNVKVTTPDGSN